MIPTTSRHLRHQFLSNVVTLSFYSYLGESMRIICAELFGTACHNPGSVGWNSADWAPCTTAPGITSGEGGAMFTDLPANLLGCFLMGLLVSGRDVTVGTTKLPSVDLPVALLPQNHVLQQWTVTHFGLRTGLCGSLTTFASWNVQMVQMICGQLVIQRSQWVSALFGYLVGWMVALQAYHVGTHVAVMIHRQTNPILAQEANHYRMQQEQLGIMVHRDLPDLERRFLHNFEVKLDEIIDVSKVALLQAWKDQTIPYRGGAFWVDLQEIEQAVLVRDEEPRSELLEVARDAGWDVAKLREWKRYSKEERSSETSVIAAAAGDNNKAFLAETQLHGTLFFVTSCLLVWGFVSLSQQQQAPYVTYRDNFLSTLLSPCGTLLRWKLSHWNGRITRKHWEWLPIGTLAANLLATTISALAAALALQTTDPTFIMWERAIKTGVAGSLSTVSTYVAETSCLLQALPRHAWGYYYSIGSLVLACCFGVVSYVWAVV